MSDEHSIVKAPSSPFRDSLASTLGAGVGVAVLAGVPTVVLGGLLVFVTWRAWRSYREWVRSRSQRTTEIGVREVQASISEASASDVSGSGLPKLSASCVTAARRGRRKVSRARAGRIVQ